MQKATAQTEAVRLAKERLGEATSEEMAAYIQGAFGLTIQPFIVSVLLGTFREREELERTNREVREKVDAWKAENPEEAKRMAATARRKEAARRRTPKAVVEEDRQVPVAEVSAPPAAGAASPRGPDGVCG